MSQLIDWTSNSIQKEIRNTNIMAWELKNNTYAAGLIPQKDVLTSTGTYWEYDKAYFMSSQVQDRSPGQVTPVARYAASKATYQVGQKHLGIAVTNEEVVESSDSLEPMNDASLFLGNNFIVDYELDFANSFISDGVWEHQAQGVASAPANPLTGNSTLALGASGAATFHQFDQAESDPIKILEQVIRTIQLTCGLRLNKFLIPRIVFDVIKNNPNIRNYAALSMGVNGGNSQTKAILAQNLDIDISAIHVVEMSYQEITSIATANRDTQNHAFGQDLTPTFGTMKWVLENAILCMFSEDSFSKHSKTAAVCMKWVGLTNAMHGRDPALSRGNLGSGIDSANLMIRGRQDEITFTSYIEGYFSYDNNVVAPQLGFYLKDCIPAL